MVVASSFKMSYEDLEFGRLMLMIGQLSSCFFIAYLLFILGNTSERMLSSVKDLKLAIQNANYHQINKTDCFCSILDEFNEFQGFEGNGYFTLNHSMLTGLTANFATFLVILVQFNQSEVP